MTVIIVPVIPSSSVRASSGVPWNASGDRGPTLTDDSTAPAARAASADSVGSTHSEPRTYSRSASRPITPTSTVQVLDKAWHLWPRLRCNAWLVSQTERQGPFGRDRGGGVHSWELAAGTGSTRPTSRPRAGFAALR